MKKEIIFILQALISLSTAILIASSQVQDNYGITNALSNNTTTNNATINLTQIATLNDSALFAQTNLTISDNYSLKSETLNITSPAILPNGTELKTDILTENISNATISVPIDMTINESKDTAINITGINATTNLTASLNNGNAPTGIEVGLLTEILPSIKQDETFLLGKGIQDEKPFEIMHLTKPMIDISKRFFISNNI